MLFRDSYPASQGVPLTRNGQEFVRVGRSVFKSAISSTEDEWASVGHCVAGQTPRAEEGDL